MAIYPKVCGDKVTFAEYNCVKCLTALNTQNLENELENAINITKLNYCKSLTETPHDYVVVDAFTDSTGYNNTISCTPGYTNAPTGICDCITAGGSIGNYYVAVCNRASSGAATCLIGHPCFAPSVCWSVITSFCYSLQCGLNAYFVCDECPRTAIVQLTVSNSHDNYPTCCICCVFGGGAVPAAWLDCTNSYCYVCLSANCWCYYKNGAGVCQVYLTDFPCILVNTYGAIGDYSKSSPHARACVCMTCFCYCAPVSTTSVYNSSALTGIYINNNFTATLSATTICACGANATVGNYYVCAYSPNYPTVSLVCACCNILSRTFSEYNTFCFCMVYVTNVGCRGCACAQTTNWQDNKCYYVCVGPSSSCCVTTTLCYCYIRVTGDDWCFYCDGTGVCQVTITSFPNIILVGFACNCCYNSNDIGAVYLCNLLFCDTTVNVKINTVQITWTNPVKMVYYTDETYGAGSRVYNVIDSSTGNCIATNVPRNTLCLLSCCVCCHRYEIIQCSDAVSCIKSYAIAIGI